MKKRLLNVLQWIGTILGIIVTIFVLLATFHQISLKLDEDKLVPNGEMIDLGTYCVHVYSEGESNGEPTLIFMSGSGTVSPTYDFSPLYSLLSEHYEIAVVEKAGYGYSDIADVDRSVDIMVDELRSALDGAEIPAPYILVPHSMSGLEAIYWTQNYPNEVSGIIGLDMAVPYSYDDFDFGLVSTMQTLGKASSILGILRIPGVYPLYENSLTDIEKEQQKLLMYRNAVNDVFIEEGRFVYDNAQVVKNGSKIQVPILMFSSNGDGIGDFWIPSQEKYAEENNAMLITYDCGHYLHHDETESIANEMLDFLSQ